MKLSFEHNTKTISFELIYRKRKTLEIRVGPPDKVTVISPFGISRKKVLQHVNKKSGWIAKKLYHFEQMKVVYKKKEFVNGESFLYLGRDYYLEIVDNKELKNPQVNLFDGKIVIETPSRDEQKLFLAMKRWYYKMANEKISQLVDYYAGKFPLKPLEVKVKEQKRRWGSCTYKNKLLFNWRCIMAPVPVVGYIVVHEMCHMLEKNHSKKFWNLVWSVLPDYKERKEWLKNNGVRMV